VNWREADVDALDGNALGGPLFEYFGSEMTTVVGHCAHCGKPSQIAELVVYSRAPGAVVRCPHCANIVLVLVTLRDKLNVDSTAFHMEQTGAER
jgi:DNA-directed RNA polymerase subunit RPC12/RpoP